MIERSVDDAAGRRQLSVRNPIGNVRRQPPVRLKTTPVLNDGFEQERNMRADAGADLEHRASHIRRDQCGDIPFPVRGRGEELKLAARIAESHSAGSAD